MPARALTPTSGILDVGDTWLMGFEVRDDETDELTDATVVVTVTRPDASTALPVPTHVSTGVYTVLYELAAAGHHTAKVVTSETVVSVLWCAVDAVVGSNRPDLATVKDYLRDAVKGWSDAQIQSALDAETAAQARVCRIPAVYPPDLAEALCRRVRRNLAMRGIPLGVQTSEVGPVRVGRDPEIRRLEAPFPKLRVG